MFKRWKLFWYSRQRNERNSNICIWIEKGGSLRPYNLLEVSSWNKREGEKAIRTVDKNLLVFFFNNETFDIKYKMPEKKEMAT